MAYSKAEIEALERDAKRWRHVTQYKGRDGWIVLAICDDETSILTGDHACALVDQEIEDDILGQGLARLQGNAD